MIDEGQAVYLVIDLSNHVACCIVESNYCCSTVMIVVKTRLSIHMTYTLLFLPFRKAFTGMHVSIRHDCGDDDAGGRSAGRSLGPLVYLSALDERQGERLMKVLRITYRGICWLRAECHAVHVCMQHGIRLFPRDGLRWRFIAWSKGG